MLKRLYLVTWLVLILLLGSSLSCTTDNRDKVYSLSDIPGGFDGPPTSSTELLAQIRLPKCRFRYFIVNVIFIIIL